MSFESILKTEIKKELNKKEYLQSFKPRPHISKSKVDEFNDIAYLKVGEVNGVHHTDELSPRYIAATNLTYDAIMSIFDVNTKKLAVYRFYLSPGKIKTDLKKYVDVLKASKPKPNLEARLIGMQNGQDYYLLLDEMADFFIANKIKLVEIDLFGTEMRHVAIDSKLGMSFNILLEDRHYRPGELTNSMTVENFEAQLKR